MQVAKIICSCILLIYQASSLIVLNAKLKQYYNETAARAWLMVKIPKD